VWSLVGRLEFRGLVSLVERESNFFFLCSQPLDGDEIGERASLADTVGNGPSNQSDAIIKPVNLTVRCNDSATPSCAHVLFPLCASWHALTMGVSGQIILARVGAGMKVEDSAGCEACDYAGREEVSE
jgi:hypothetical protein